MKKNLRISECCESCFYYIPDGGNGYCDEDGTYTPVTFRETKDPNVLWAWASEHATLKTNICDDYKKC